MTQTQFVHSSDGTRIAYDVTECTAPTENTRPVLLVHGYSDDRQSNWHHTGWVERLQPDFHVVTVDLRGCGESETYADVGRYRLEDYIADLRAVIDAAGYEQYLYFGWSFGATLGLHLAAHYPGRLLKLAAAGTHFGLVFEEAVIQPVIGLWEQLIAIKEAGDYDKIAPEERNYLKQVDAQAVLTRWKAPLEHHYAGVQPDALNVPTLLLSATGDEHVIGELRANEAAIEAAGVQLHVFDDMDHHGLIGDVETVLPVVRAFLA